MAGPRFYFVKVYVVLTEKSAKYLFEAKGLTNLVLSGYDFFFFF